MSVRVPKALRLLRERAPEVLAAAEGVAGLVPWMNLLRDLLDTRPRQVKIEDSVLRVCADLVQHHEDRAVVGIARRKLEVWLPQLPLTAVPSDPVIRRILREHDMKIKRNYAPKLSHESLSTCNTTSTSTTF